MASITDVLNALGRGDTQAAKQLPSLVYAELRRLAAAKMAREKPGQTLDATALVHEAYIRLVPKGKNADRPEPEWNSRNHFFGAAAEAMRRILVENARRKARLKHGGDHARQSIPDSELAAPVTNVDLLALNEALEQLTAIKADAAQLVKLRYFAGLTQQQAAEVMNMPLRSANRLWAYARGWLFTKLRESAND